MTTETFICNQCETEFSRTRTRGRKPKSCPSCRQASKAPNSTPKARKTDSSPRIVQIDTESIIDRLEAALKSRGQHISQHS